MAARDARCHLQESLKEGRDRQRNEGARGEGRAGFPGQPRANGHSGKQEGVCALVSRKEFPLLGVGS